MKLPQFICVAFLFLLSAAVLPTWAQAGAPPKQSYVGSWAPEGTKEARLFLFPDGGGVLDAPCLGGRGRWVVRADGRVTMDLVHPDGFRTKLEMSLSPSDKLQITKPKDFEFTFIRTPQPLPRR